MSEKDHHKRAGIKKGILPSKSNLSIYGYNCPCILKPVYVKNPMRIIRQFRVGLFKFIQHGYGLDVYFWRKVWCCTIARHYLLWRLPRYDDGKRAAGIHWKYGIWYDGQFRTWQQIREILRSKISRKTAS